jgi:hypothetical protein
MLWDAAAGTRVYQVEANRVEVTAVAFSPRGDAWAAAGYGGPVRLFHARRTDLLLGLGAAGDDEEGRHERVVAVAFARYSGTQARCPGARADRTPLGF